MPQYTFDDKGNAIGVFLPISDWNRLKTKFGELEETEDGLPEWQKTVLDERLAIINNHPEKLRPVEELFEELDKD